MKKPVYSKKKIEKSHKVLKFKSGSIIEERWGLYWY